MAFGPGSLLYEIYGDRGGFLMAPTAGLLQLMYPALGRGVEQHSAFYDEPFERLFRSVPQIQGMIFDGPRAGAQALQVRDFHAGIKGTFDDGARYHALDPETFFWAHATFLDAVFRASDLFWRRPLTEPQKEAVYAEGIEWWQMYGLSMRVVPPTYGDFLDYWDYHLDEVLQATPAARGLVDFMNHPAAMDQPWLPRPLWRVMAGVGGIPARDLAIGSLPEPARERLGFTWSPVQQAAFDAFRYTWARTWPLLPERVRLMPRARAAYRRQGRLGLDASLAALPASRAA